METKEAPKQVSTMMEEPQYNAATHTLTITFKKGGVYNYPNFAPEKFAEFHGAKSWGAWFHANRPLFKEGIKQIPATEVVA